MLKKFKIWQCVFIISLILIIIRFDLLLNTVLLIFYFIRLSFYDFGTAYNQLSFNLLDAVVSLTAIAVPIAVFIKRNKIKLLGRNLDFTSLILIMLGFFFVYAPLVGEYNPDFQKNLSVTKLLGPFSSKKVLHLKQASLLENPVTGYLNVKNRVIKKSYNENIILADSIIVNNKIIYYQDGIKYILDKSRVETENGAPVISTNYYLFGTDELGRDIFTRLIYGARVSLFVGLGSVIVSFILGLGMGFIAGYSGGFINSFFNRISEMFLVFPVLFLIILILALFGNSIISIIVILGFSGWMSLFKIVRGEVLSIKEKDFFITARLIGLTHKDLLFKEVLPVILAPVVVNLVFQYGNVILAEAALSFLGIGTGGVYPSWGAMIEAGQNYLSQAWWMIFFPGLFLSVTLYTANNLGKKLQVYFNPRLDYD